MGFQHMHSLTHTARTHNMQTNTPLRHLMRQVSGGSQETLDRFALRPPLPSCLPFPSNTGGLLMATSIPRALLRTHACETCGILGETAMRAGQDNSGSWLREERLFCDERCTDKPQRKVVSCKMGVSSRPLHLLLCRPHGKGKLWIRHTGCDL